MRTVTEIILWFILASLAVLVIMNPKGFIDSFNAVGSFALTAGSQLSGSGYKKAA